MIYRIVRLLPYIILLILAFAFTLAYKFTSSELSKTILINLSSSSLFVVLAYFFYDIIKSYIAKRELRYIDSYIRNQISNDVFIVLYTLKKYIHGYNLESNTVKNIFEINNYSKEQIRASIVNQSYLGFQIFREMEDVKELFRDALDNNLVIKYCPREYVMNLVRIVDLIIQIEHIFRNENNYSECPEKAVEFLCVNGKELNPDNEESRFLLLKRAEVKNRAVVYDSGKFDQSKEKKLLNRYIIEPQTAEIVAQQIYELNRYLRFWLPEEFHIRRYDRSYRIIKDYFSPFTKAATLTKRIYVADIVEFKK